jgi:hypothetical protein
VLPDESAAMVTATKANDLINVVTLTGLCLRLIGRITLSAVYSGRYSAK